MEEWKCRLQAAEVVLQQRAQLLEDHNQALCDQNCELGDRNVALETMVHVKKEAVEHLEQNVCEKIREKQVWSSSHSFTMLKLHDDNVKHGYYVIRCQGRRLGGAIKKLRSKFPTAEVLYQQRKVPNSVNLYSRIKEQKAVNHSHNYCSPT